VRRYSKETSERGGITHPTGSLRWESHAHVPADKSWMLRTYSSITQLTHLSIVSGGYLALGGNDGRICPWLRLPRFRRTISTMEVHQALEMLGGPAARSSRGCLDALPATQLPLSLPLSLLPVFFPSTGKAPLCLKAKRKSRVSVGSCAG